MNNKKIIITIFAAVVIIMAGFIYTFETTEPVDHNLSFTKEIKDVIKEETVSESERESTGKEHAELSDSTAATSEEFVTESSGDLEYSYIHICGEVKSPGVYQVSSGTRIIEVIELAGGLTKAAAADYINQAEKVSDGQKIYIPSEKEIEDLTVNHYSKVQNDLIQNNSILDGKNDSKNDEQSVNINTATVDELMTLPGIGEAKAKSILGYRETNGNFKSIEDLKNIEGIKDGVFNKIRDSVHIN